MTGISDATSGCRNIFPENKTESKFWHGLEEKHFSPCVLCHEGSEKHLLQCGLTASISTFIYSVLPWKKLHYCNLLNEGIFGIVLVSHHSGKAIWPPNAFELQQVCRLHFRVSIKATFKKGVKCPMSRTQNKHGSSSTQPLSQGLTHSWNTHAQEVFSFASIFTHMTFSHQDLDFHQASF